MYVDAYTMHTKDTNYNFHINVIELIQAQQYHIILFELL